MTRRDHHFRPRARAIAALSVLVTVLLAAASGASGAESGNATHRQSARVSDFVAYRLLFRALAAEDHTRVVLGDDFTPTEAATLSSLARGFTRRLDRLERGGFDVGPRSPERLVADRDRFTSAFLRQLTRRLDRGTFLKLRTLCRGKVKDRIRGTAAPTTRRAAP